MRKDGINIKKSGTPAKNMTEAECKKYGVSIGKWSRTDITWKDIAEWMFR